MFRARLFFGLPLVMASISCSDVGEAPGETMRIAAAASLSDVLPSLVNTYTLRKNIHIDFVFGGSGELASQLRHGADFDLLFLANIETLHELKSEGFLFKNPILGPRNQLLLVAGTDKENYLSGLNELSIPQIRIAIGSLGVPAGDCAREWLDSSGLMANWSEKLVEFPHVRAVLAALENQSCSAGFIYATDLPKKSSLQTLAEAPSEFMKPYGLGVPINSDMQTDAQELAIWLSEQKQFWADAGFDRVLQNLRSASK